MTPAKQHFPVVLLVFVVQCGSNLTPEDEAIQSTRSSQIFLWHCLFLNYSTILIFDLRMNFVQSCLSHEPKTQSSTDTYFLNTLQALYLVPLKLEF